MMKKFKFLGALFVGLIGLVSFGYGYISIPTSISLPGGETIDVVKGDCFRGQNSSAGGNLSLYLSDGTLVHTNIGFNNTNMMCATDTGYIYNKSSSAIGLYYYNVQEITICSSCTNYTSEECQQEYSLMPITSCNSEYCGLNGLCPEYTGSTMSELYINGINHLGAPIINISIPLEQAWDYEYTGDIMNINLSGENNVDYEYIDNIIRTQRSTPNDEDLNNIVSGLIPLFVPGLVLIVFIIFIFRFIKKIF